MARPRLMEDKNTIRRYIRITADMDAWLKWWCAREGLAFEHAFIQALKLYYQERRDLYPQGPRIPEVDAEIELAPKQKPRK